ncbi:(S)-benzoin forming benzil reductase [Lentibacillus sp. Marseille-P4043]|uniref:(S)-benzoin forming benzil reductase n=1 Tax=Lentibacillus sp. Marseille-P4043 TaxID=2040293 RepID=UPI000D0B701C|nr:(S)-benzoin forming benzil reductase [Lentibacillus sp. Marseille-P4043]
MKFAVITGVSRGLGEAVARLFIELGINVIGISRSKNEQLAAYAKQQNVMFSHYTCDLADMEKIEETIDNIGNLIVANDPSTVYLVNNAAVVEPIDQSVNIQNSDLKYHIQINTLAPMVIMNSFLKMANEQGIHFVGATITSGAAERPVYGWSAYCSTKASINMYTQTVALEQNELQTDSKVIAFSPGIMDTQMQEKIRLTSAENFAEVDKFNGYKRNNLLKDTEMVGGVLVDILTDEENIQSGNIYHVNDYI